MRDGFFEFNESLHTSHFRCEGTYFGADRNVSEQFVFQPFHLRTGFFVK